MCIHVCVCVCVHSCAHLTNSRLPCSVFLPSPMGISPKAQFFHMEITCWTCSFGSTCSSTGSSISLRKDSRNHSHQTAESCSCFRGPMWSPRWSPRDPRHTPRRSNVVELSRWGRQWFHGNVDNPQSRNTCWETVTCIDSFSYFKQASFFCCWQKTKYIT